MYVLGFIISSQQYEIDTTTFKKHDAEKTANIKWLCPYHEHGRRTSTAFDASSFTETGTPVPNPESQNGALHCSINLQHIRAFAIKSQEVLQHISGMTGRLILRRPCPKIRPTDSLSLCSPGAYSGCRYLGRSSARNCKETLTAKGPKAQFETGRRRRGRMCWSPERDGQPVRLCDSRSRSYRGKE